VWREAETGRPKKSGLKYRTRTGVKEVDDKRGGLNLQERGEGVRKGGETTRQIGRPTGTNLSSRGGRRGGKGLRMLSSA